MKTEEESEVDFNVSDEESDLIAQIAERVGVIEVQRGREFTHMQRICVKMDLTACHCNGCPLDLAGLLAADRINLMHDVLGIDAHLNRSSGKLEHCFLPRYAIPQPAGAPNDRH